MTKSPFAALFFAGLVSACSLIEKPPAPSPFLATQSNVVLTISIPAREATAVLILVARNQGVETWQTGDNVTVSMRSGVVVATRGLGFDVMGSDVQPTLDALAGRRSGSYAITRRYLTADNQPQTVTATCTMGRLAKDGRFAEECDSPQGAFRNEYWLDGAGKIVRSNQWIGPEVQFLSTAYAVAG